ncbi:hypothetical protein TSAR_016905 [Trichomalopsis sarcophagae]|uniref:Caspase family p20 domain-containing protein n=1 Tax=Trichomalopsis sarcophagae TaxID=543379 RepID=A0A232F6M9_9HYME|nr:hypothetical protein TSAR_016905 [Trichomalopsis sarcophagae]
MSLVIDAISTIPESLNNVVRFSRERFNPNVLQEIVQDADSLDEMDIMSIIFLFTDQETEIHQLIEFVQNDPATYFNTLRHRVNWEEKLLESLIIIGNIKVIKRLGFDNNEIEAMKVRFVYNVHNVSENLNKVIKSLYFVCSNLETKEVSKLITKVNERLCSPVQLDSNKLWLEVYILHWLQQNYISINEDNPNLNNLIEDLKNIGCLIDLPFNFEDWKTTHRNLQDSSKTLINDNSMPFTSNNTYNQNDNNPGTTRIPWGKKQKRLCIIINQKNFKNKVMYKFRRGSDADEKNLIETLRGCNFEIDEPKRDLTKSQMIDFLDSFNTERYNQYACIFMCILSHGSEGEVVFSDDKKISIDTIRDKFCCEKLKNVFKFIILQSCQGKQIGLVERNSEQSTGRLVTDGLTSPVFYKHFGLFQATLNGFVAFRNEDEGSWFIQDICTELRISTPTIVTEWVKKVKKRVGDRRATCTNFKEIEAVQIPCSSDTISDDYMIPKYQEFR